MPESIIKQKSTYADNINQYMQPPTPERLQCVHCGEVFTGKTSLQKLRNHLRFCEKRVLLRHVKFESYIFVLTMNPKKKLRLGLDQLLNEPDTIAEPGLAVGAFLLAKKLGQIRDYQPIDILSSPEFLKLQNGSLSYRKIVASLSTEDRNRFGAFANHIFQNRYNEVKA